MPRVGFEKHSALSSFDFIISYSVTGYRGQFVQMRHPKQRLPPLLTPLLFSLDWAKIYRQSSATAKPCRVFGPFTDKDPSPDNAMASFVGLVDREET